MLRDWKLTLEDLTTNFQFAQLSKRLADQIDGYMNLITHEYLTCVKMSQVSNASPTSKKYVTRFSYVLCHR